jgi:hypothetical protein
MADDLSPAEEVDSKANKFRETTESVGKKLTARLLADIKIRPARDLFEIKADHYEDILKPVVDLFENTVG